MKKNIQKKRLVTYTKKLKQRERNLSAGKASMNVEEARLRSFVSWPANTPVNPRQLAECGFYASGPFLEAECNWCHCRISNWEYGDVVERRHRTVSPQCEFITNRSCCGNVSMQLPTDGDSSQPLSSSGVINQSSDQRNLPDLMIESNRLATFKNWPVCFALTLPSICVY